MTPLPLRLAPRPGQSLPDWLGQVAKTNGITPSRLGSILRADGRTTRFLAVRPEDRTIAAISTLTGQPTTVVMDATLARFDGTALNLEGLHHARWSSWRTVAGRGWFRPRGTAACPQCLAADSYWRVEWRLPTVTVCTRHVAYLVELCPGCRRRFADSGHEPLRHGTGTRCWNPTAPHQWCDTDVATLDTARASMADIARQHRHDAACGGTPIAVFGKSVTAREYLADVRHLAVLLLHLATRPDADDIAAWGADVRREEATTGRTRWHLAPPTDPRVRSAVLTNADAILTAPALDAAATMLAPWVEAAPSGTDSRLGWLADRTTMTSDLTRLTMAALAPHQRVSTHLARTGAPLEPSRIPQVLPESLYRRHACHLFTTDKAETNRLFVSLCLARQAGATTWADAARSLDLEPDFGTRTARAISARSRPDPRDLTAALDAIRSDLRGHFGVRELQVRRLMESDAWFENWAIESRPGTRLSSFPYAVTYLWCSYACGLLVMSPAWSAGPTRSQRAAYRQFAASLSQLASEALLAVPQSPCDGAVT